MPDNYGHDDPNIELLEKLVNVLTEDQVQILIESSVKVYCQAHDMRLVSNPRKGLKNEHGGS